MDAVAVHWRSNPDHPKWRTIFPIRLTDCMTGICRRITMPIGRKDGRTDGWMVSLVLWKMCFPFRLLLLCEHNKGGKKSHVDNICWQWFSRLFCFVPYIYINILGWAKKMYYNENESSIYLTGVRNAFWCFKKCCIHSRFRSSLLQL